MTGPSPPRRGVQFSSPERNHVATYLSDNRNNELTHQEALAASKAEHDRVRENALRVIEIHSLQLEQLRLEEKEALIRERQKKEHERLEREKRLRAEEQRLRDLEAQRVPELPPKPKPQEPPAGSSQSAGVNGAAAQGTVNTQPAAPKTGLFDPPKVSPAVKPLGEQANGASKADAKPTGTPFGQVPSSVPGVSSPFAKLSPAAASPAANPFGKPVVDANPFAKPAPTLVPNGAVSAPAQPARVQPAPVQVQPPPAADRYVQIHQNLKKLRAMIKVQMTTNIDLKKNAGNMRREIRKSIGQLTSEKGANRDKLEKIKRTLIAALSGQPSSLPIDPSNFVCDTREPAPEPALNGQLPSLFLYLINCLAKDMIKQFDGECGPVPSKADPIGVVAAQVFSTKDFLWRGKPLIDIMMAKFRVSCPVLFGYRGSEKTEQGRARLGWRKIEGQWMNEQQHFDRMKGLGVGYASIALRDFSKAKNTNPYPPANYWTSLAKIVNTPPTEISDTQCVVLRAMIYLYEEKFINFYGNQAIAALRKALVEFPAKAPNQTASVSSLQVLAQLYLKDSGLDLR